MLGMVLGLLLGFAIFIATNWLIVKGGHTTPSGEYIVGPHLALLSIFPWFRFLDWLRFSDYFWGFRFGLFLFFLFWRGDLDFLDNFWAFLGQGEFLFRLLICECKGDGACGQRIDDTFFHPLRFHTEKESV